MTISHPRVEWKSEVFCKEARDVTRKWSIINEMVRRDSDRKKRLFKFLDSVIGGPTTPKMFFPSRCIETQVDRSIRSWGGNVSIRFLSGKLLRKGTCFIDSFRVPDQISQVARTPASRLILTTSFYSFPLPRCPFPTPNGHFPTALAPPSFPSHRPRS